MCQVDNIINILSPPLFFSFAGELIVNFSLLFLGTESWSLISGPCISTLQPPARHYHSAVIHGNQMHIYGGMNNLDAKSDFWRWNLSRLKFIDSNLTVFFVVDCDI